VAVTAGWATGYPNAEAVTDSNAVLAVTIGEHFATDSEVHIGTLSHATTTDEMARRYSADNLVVTKRSTAHCACQATAPGWPASTHE